MRVRDATVVTMFALTIALGATGGGLMYEAGQHAKCEGRLSVYRQENNMPKAIMGPVAHSGVPREVNDRFLDVPITIDETGGEFVLRIPAEFDRAWYKTRCRVYVRIEKEPK